MRANIGDKKDLRLIVCADDYAFTPGISSAIRDLLAAGRISATSVMTGSPYWPAEAGALKTVAGAADIGLHVTLTDQKPLGTMPTFAPAGRLPPMAAVYRAGMLRRLPLDEIAAEIDRQLECFIRYLGAPPAHIDGHHHVQQLPGVRDLVVAAAARIGPGRTWVRSGNERLATICQRGVAISKSILIGTLGAGIRHRALAAGVPVNSGFSGAYDFVSDRRPIAELFARFVIGAGDRTVVMCHPGISDAGLADLDVMTSARDAEYGFLMSDAWPRLLAEHGLVLAPFGTAQA